MSSCSYAPNNAQTSTAGRESFVSKTMLTGNACQCYVHYYVEVHNAALQSTATAQAVL